MTVLPAKTQVSLGIRLVWSESSLSTWRKLGSLATHWAHSEDWSDWANAQADLSHRWADSHFVGFVMSRLISVISDKDLSSTCTINVFKMSRSMTKQTNDARPVWSESSLCVQRAADEDIEDSD